MALSLNLQNNFNFSKKRCYTLKWDIFPYECNYFLECAKALYF